MAKILLIEDQTDFCEAIRHVLAPEHQVTCAHNVGDAKNLIQRETFEMILMDLGLPDGSGFQLCTYLRNNSSTREVPIMVLSGNVDCFAKVTALDLGADDYLPKPFQKEELMARIRARLRTAPKGSVGPFTVDPRSHRVFFREGAENRDLQLTPFEYRLLACFIQRAGQALTRDNLIAACAGNDTDISDRIIDLHICSIRKKIGKQYNYIRTVYGIGYMLQTDGDDFLQKHA